MVIICSSFTFSVKEKYITNVTYAESRAKKENETVFLLLNNILVLLGTSC